jgi:hypothetical protein
MQPVAKSALAILSLVVAGALCACGSSGAGASAIQGDAATGGSSGSNGSSGGGSGSSGSGSSSGGDGGGTAPQDASSPAGYPASHPSPPQVISLGGPVIAPYIVPITYPGDPFAAQIEAFTAGIGATPYWSTVTAEYGAGPATSAPPVHITTAAPATIDDSAIQQFIKSNVGTTLPAAKTGIVYAFFFPASTTVTWNGAASCDQNEGYHWDLALGGGTNVSYVVVPRCDTAVGAPGVTGIDATTLVASHEYVEATTDPFPTLNPAYGDVDGDHTIWGVMENVEVGDLCTWATGVAIKPPGFDFTVQRIWSNAAVKAGHDPCVPAPAEVPYFNTVPELDDSVVITNYGQPTTTKGVNSNPGQSKTISLWLYSDGPTAGPWTVSAVDAPYYGIPATTHNLTYSFDKTQGQNGDRIRLTITVNGYDSQIGGAPFMITSTLGQQSNTWFGVVAR